MDSKEFRELINKERPSYSNIHKTLIDKMSVKGKQSSDFISFGPYYQAFMYAFIVGYHIGDRTEMPSRGSTTNFYEIGKWKPQSVVNYILSLIYSDLNKGGFNWVELEQFDGEQLQNHVSDIILLMEEYANTGFIFLGNKFEHDPGYFTQIYSFVDLLNEVTKLKQVKEKESIE